MCGRLVAPAVFKTDEAEVLGLAGSIPVHLRSPFAFPRQASGPTSHNADIGSARIRSPKGSASGPA